MAAKEKGALKKKIGKFFDKITLFYNTKIYPILKKIGYALTHNFVINQDNLYLYIFKGIKIKKTRKRRAAFFGYLFISLWIVGFLVFTLYPMVYSFILSFNKSYFSYTSGVSMEAVGFSNYIGVFRDSRLLPLFGAHIGKMIIAVPLVIIFSIIIAVLINNPIRLKGFWRTVFFLPVVISTGPVLNELTSQGAATLPSLAESGVMTFITNNVGEWLANPLEIILNSMLSILWYAGIPILLFLAGLQKVDPSIYEAASIDGASPWDRFWKITLPSIKPLITVAIIYTVVSISLFVEEGGILDLVKRHMTEGSPQSAFWHGYGYASAIAWIYFFLMVLIMGIFILITSVRRRDKA